jgi:uncharacterized protein YkwD
MERSLREDKSMKIPVLVSFLVLTFTAATEIRPAGNVCVSADEKKLYDLIMAYRKEKNLSAIPLSAKLTQVAQIHAKDLSEHHDPFNGKCNLHSWSKNGTWTACCYTNDHAQAECMWNKPREIAGYESAGYEISFYYSTGATPEGSLKGWQESSGHNQLLINDGVWKNMTWNAIGVGVYKEYSVVWFGDLRDETVPGNCN